MHPHQDVRLPHRFTHDEGQVGLVVDHALVGEAAELAELRGEAGLGGAAHQPLGLAPVANEVGDGDQNQAVLGGEDLEIVAPGHVEPVLGHHLAQHTGGRQAGQAGQVDSGLGVPGPLEDATVTGAQNVQVTGPGQVVRPGGRVNERPGGQGPIGRRDAGRGAHPAVDGNGEGRSLRFGVPLHHEREVELIGPVVRDGDADEPGCVAHEKSHRLRRGVLGRDDQISFVLAVLVVDHDHDLAGCDGGNGVFDGSRRHGHDLSFEPRAL